MPVDYEFALSFCPVADITFFLNYKSAKLSNFEWNFGWFYIIKRSFITTLAIEIWLGKLDSY